VNRAKKKDDEKKDEEEPEKNVVPDLEKNVRVKKLKLRGGRGTSVVHEAGSRVEVREWTTRRVRDKTGKRVQLRRGSVASPATAKAHLAGWKYTSG
jgi:hypothetical protein